MVALKHGLRTHGYSEMNVIIQCKDIQVTFSGLTKALLKWSVFLKKNYNKIIFETNHAITLNSSFQ